MVLTILLSVWKNLKKVNNKAVAEGRCAVLKGNVMNMPYSATCFDAVTAFETIYFWQDLPKCFCEIYRVLKPGGTFLICNEVSGDEAKDEKWTKIIEGMTIYKDTELKKYISDRQCFAIFRFGKRIIGCALRRKSEGYYVKKKQRNFSVWQ